MAVGRILVREGNASVDPCMSTSRLQFQATGSPRPWKFESVCSKFAHGFSVIRHKVDPFRARSAALLTGRKEAHPHMRVCI
jgi:hypothetical protein